MSRTVLSATLPTPTQPLVDQIEAALDRYSRFGEGCPPRLQEAIRHSLLAPGKRLRPLLVLSAADLCGGSPAAALPAACAVEMIHAYSLIHDDLPAMDDDDLRRGRPSCHAAFGEALAILAGDALQARAFEIISEIQPPDVAAMCCRELARACGATQLVGGQVDDLYLPEIQDLAALESIHSRKTGALFVVSLRLGALVAGANRAMLEKVTAFGMRLGLAFQIIDDLLDLSGDESTVGKRTGKDAQLGKLTFASLLGPEESRLRGSADPGGQSATCIARLAVALFDGTCGVHSATTTLGAPSMTQLLPRIQSPSDLQPLSLVQLEQVASEIRDVLCNLVSTRSAHFASNLGVVELCLALHMRLRLRERSLDLGHGPSDLPAQTGHGPLSRIRNDSDQGRADGLPESAREHLRPVHDRSRRLQCLDRAWAEERRRSDGR